MRRFLFIFLVGCGLWMSGPGHAQDPEAEVRRLIAAAKGLDTAWPWQGPIPEVYIVAKRGKSAAPYLVKHLQYGPDTPFFGWDLHVEQQIELALCIIFDTLPVSGETVYGIRSFADTNRTIRGFWEARVQRYLGTGK